MSDIEEVQNQLDALVEAGEIVRCKNIFTGKVVYGPANSKIPWYLKAADE